MEVGCKQIDYADLAIFEILNDCQVTKLQTKFLETHLFLIPL